MHNHELLGGIFTPCVESVKEHLTIDLLTVNNRTSLGGNHHPRITTIVQLFTHVTLCSQTNQLFGGSGTNKDFLDILVVDGLQ